MTARTKRRRLFFALWPDPAVAEQLAAGYAPIEVSPNSKADLHLTVLFLGQVPESQVGALVAAAGSIQNPAIQQLLVRLEFWPQSGVICWVGDPVHALERLRAALERAVSNAGVELQPERMEFRPHVTLGRSLQGAPGFVPPPVEPLLLHSRRFTLAESVPRRDGRRYEQLASWFLAD